MLRPAARLTLLVCLLTGCAGADDPDDRRARRARQMRDVSHMLDAMEHPDRPSEPHETAPMPLAVPAVSAAGPSPGRNSWHLGPGMIAAAIALSVLVMSLTVPLARRRRRSRHLAEAASASVHFAETPVTPVQGTTGGHARPTWIYRTSPYETPLLHMVPAPVDLLPPWPPEPTPSAALALARTALQQARSLTGSEADDACSFALMHAFLAEQDPSLRAEAAACRQEATVLYEALPHRRC